MLSEASRGREPTGAGAHGCRSPRVRVAAGEQQARALSQPVRRWSRGEPKD